MINIFVPLGRETILRPQYGVKLQKFGMNILPGYYDETLDQSVRLIYEKCDGVMLIGGVDIYPERYASSKEPKTSKPDFHRDEVDLKTLDLAYFDKKPVFGICRGGQIIAIHRGLQLEQHVPKILSPDKESHSAEEVPETLAALVTHEIDIAGESRLGRIIGKTKAPVVCAHHQALDYKPNPYLKLSAISKAGIPEAWESYDSNHFVIGVQFHPELGSGLTDKIFESFAKASEEYRFRK